MHPPMISRYKDPPYPSLQNQPTNQPTNQPSIANLLQLLDATIPHPSSVPTGLNEHLISLNALAKVADKSHIMSMKEKYTKAKQHCLQQKLTQLPQLPKETTPSSPSQMTTF